MPIDEALVNKRDEEMTSEDVRTVVNAPDEEERPLVDPNIFNEKQPDKPIYKNIPLKFALAGAVTLILTVPVIRLFSGNLIAGNKSERTTTTEEGDTTETEAEKAQRLTAEENADLKRKLALQNQSFTAQEIASAEEEDAAPGQNTSSQPVTAKPPAPQRPQSVSVPVSRPIAAARPAPVRPTPVRPSVSRAISSSRPAPATTTVAASPREPMDLEEIAAAGNYGQLPSRSIPKVTSARIAAPVVSETNSPRFITVANRESSFSGDNSIPVSVRAQARLATTQTASEVSNTRKRPLPSVMKESISTASAEPKQVGSGPSEEIELSGADTYEAQRDLIMRETEGLRRTSPLPSLLLPGSAAELEVTTAVTWASDLPKALGSVTLISPLSSNGAEVMPKGTELVVQIGDMSASGAVALDVVAMVLPGSGEVAEINIPTGALEILAAGGGYPVARAEQSSERQLQAIDRQQALLGAVGAAGDYLNRPQRETSVFGLGGSSTSREFGSGSLWGSLLSGAAKEMLRSRSNRLDAEADRLMERPTIWSIESGRRLQLFVTQEVAL